MLPEPRVFVVDDDQMVCAALEMLLRDAGLQVQTFASAEAFLGCLPQIDTCEPQCLVLDVLLPGMSGLELQASLLRILPHLPILMITGYVEVATVVRAIQSGAFDFLEKPLNRGGAADEDPERTGTRCPPAAGSPAAVSAGCPDRPVDRAGVRSLAVDDEWQQQQADCAGAGHQHPDGGQTYRPNPAQAAGGECDSTGPDRTKSDAARVHWSAACRTQTCLMPAWLSCPG
jgi:CheY-like chemotaxis protein